MDDLISRSALFNDIFVCNGKVCPNTDIDNFPITFDVKDIKNAILNQPTAYDVEKVVQQLEELQEKSKELFDFGISYNTYGEALEIVRKGGKE